MMHDAQQSMQEKMNLDELKLSFNQFWIAQLFCGTKQIKLFTALNAIIALVECGPTAAYTHTVAKRSWGHVDALTKREYLK